LLNVFVQLANKRGFKHTHTQKLADNYFPYRSGNALDSYFADTRSNAGWGAGYFVFFVVFISNPHEMPKQYRDYVKIASFQILAGSLTVLANGRCVV
jgi:hypothetical protein